MKSGIVSKLTCLCGSTYIGQIRRNLLSRTSEVREIFYTKSMQTLATVHEIFCHLQYIYIFTQTLYIRTFSSLPKTPHQDLELN